MFFLPPTIKKCYIIMNTVGNMNTMYTTGLYLYHLKGFAKLLLVYMTATAIEPFTQILYKYLIPTEYDYYVVFLILLVLDIASGLYKHSGLWTKDKKSTLDKDDFFFKLFRKLFAGSIWLILINMINQMDNASEYFDTFGISVLVSWLGWSIASNLYVITGSTFPPKWVMSKLQKANEDEQLKI